MELQDPEISEKKLSTVLEEENTGLSPAFQNKALILTAFLRIADLSETGNQRFLPCRFRQLDGAVEIELMGPDAEKTAKKAEKRSELWEYLFSTELRFTQARKPLESEDSERAQRRRAMKRRLKKLKREKKLKKLKKLEEKG